MRPWFFLLFILIAGRIFSAEVKIIGKADDYKGKKIFVYQTLDYISFREEKKAQVVIASDGSFELKFNIDSTSYLTIKSNNSISHLYAEPGNKYNIKLLPPDTSDQNLPGFKKLYFRFNDLPGNDLNHIIDSLNTRIDVFLIKNYRQFLSVNVKKLVDKFTDTLKKEFGGFTQPYFKVYLKYSIASLEESSYRRRDEMTQKYFSDSPIHYQNDGYMNFFNQFYKNQMLIIAYKKHGLALNNALQEKISYQAIVKAYSKDSLLQDPGIRELVIIKGLSELYYNREYKRANILALLDSAYDNSSVKQHREIISNLKYELKYLSDGSKVPPIPKAFQPDFVFNDDQTKYTYLSFFEPDCIPCIEQFKLMQKLYDKYQNEVNFISVTNDDMEQVNALKSKYKLTWSFTQDKDEELYELFRVKRVPLYVLISPDGTIKSYPASSPEEIEKVLFEISGGEEKKKKLQKD